MGHDDWNWMDVRKLADAIGWAPREIEDLINRGLVPCRREGNRTIVPVSDFVRYVSGRDAYGQQARANVRATAEHSFDPKAPLIIDIPHGSLVIDAPRGKSASYPNLIEEINPRTGARTVRRRNDIHDIRRDFFPPDE